VIACDFPYNYVHREGRLIPDQAIRGHGVSTCRAGPESTRRKTGGNVEANRVKEQLASAERVEQIIDEMCNLQGECVNLAHEHQQAADVSVQRAAEITAKLRSYRVLLEELKYRADPLMQLAEQPEIDLDHTPLKRLVVETQQFCGSNWCTTTVMPAKAFLDRLKLKLRNLVERLNSNQDKESNGDSDPTQQQTDTNGWLRVSTAAFESKINKGEISKACDSGAIHSIGKRKERRIDPASFKVWVQNHKRGREIKESVTLQVPEPAKAISSGFCCQCSDTVTLNNGAGKCPKCGSTAFEPLLRNVAQPTKSDS
jgi:hypothetical protein